jgi:hypothetical protein
MPLTTADLQEILDLKKALEEKAADIRGRDIEASEEIMAAVKDLERPGSAINSAVQKSATSLDATAGAAPAVSGRLNLSAGRRGRGPRQ